MLFLWLQKTAFEMPMYAEMVIVKFVFTFLSFHSRKIDSMIRYGLVDNRPHPYSMLIIVQLFFSVFILHKVPKESILGI